MVYLDHNATTPLDARVLEAMLPFLRGTFANASSSHRPGRVARDAVETARQQVAALVDAEPAAVAFTSGGTEANNLAIKGVAALGGRGRLLYSGGIILIILALLYFLVILGQAGFNIKGLGDRVPAFVWITLMISIGFQCFFFGLMLQLVKQMKYKIDRIGRDAILPGSANGRAEKVGHR